MALRKSAFLKFLALLLFTFELLAPVYLSTRVDEQDEESSHLQLHTASPLSIFSSLLYEAGSEEEREGKEHQKTFHHVAEVNFISVFNSRVQQDNVTQPECLSKQLTLHTSLNTLYSVFRI
jgi:hypothetical protein